MDHKREEELLADHLAGRSGVFDVLVARHVDGLYAFFQRFVGNASAAEDLVQETFLQVHLAANTFDPSRSFKPWMYTIAANKARDYMRARSRRPAQSLDVAGRMGETPSPGAALADHEPAPLEQLDRAEESERVRAVIAQMPDHLRLILILGYYQRLPYAQIAEILEIPVGTVKSRLHSAVTHFARLWLGRPPAST